VVSETLVDDCRSGNAWKSDATLVSLAIDCCKKHGIRCSAGKTVSTSMVAATPVEKQSLAERYGALAVDMESAHVASWADGLGIPMLAIRVISDLAEDCLPPQMAGLFDKNGKIRLGQSAKVVVSTPSSVVSLYRFKKKFDLSMLVLARIMLPFLERL
jgi:nucleoside phosphorylase